MPQPLLDDLRALASRQQDRAIQVWPGVQGAAGPFEALAQTVESLASADTGESGRPRPQLR